jgi:hypothetical protein
MAQRQRQLKCRAGAGQECSGGMGQGQECSGGMGQKSTHFFIMQQTKQTSAEQTQTEAATSDGRAKRRAGQSSRQ